MEKIIPPTRPSPQCTRGTFWRAGDVERDVDDVGPDADGTGHHLHRPADARHLATGHVVDLAGGAPVAGDRRHQRGDVSDVDEVDERLALAGKEDRAAGLQAGEEDRIPRDQRAHRAERVGDAQDRHRQPVRGVLIEQVLLATHLADAVRLAEIGVSGIVGAERLQHRLHEAAPVDRRRAREHEVPDAPAEQLDHRLEIGDVVGRVVVHDVELFAMGAEDLAERTRDAPVTVEPPHRRRDLGFVAVDDRHLMAAPHQLVHQVQADVAVAPRHQRPHAGRLLAIRPV